MGDVKVWLCGEGSCEIGDRDQWGGQRQGALEALLLRVAPEGWKVIGATRWKSLRKFVAPLDKADKRGPADGKNVRGLLYEARRKGADVVAFLRDMDDHEARAEIIQRGVSDSSSRRTADSDGSSLRVIGGFPRPALEGWILALCGARDTDAMSRNSATAKLKARGISDKDVEAYVAIIEKADLEAIPQSSGSLSTWFTHAKTELSGAILRSP